MALGALFEAISIGLLVPFIAVLKEPELALKVSAARSVFHSLNVHHPHEVVIAVGLALVGVFFIKSGYLMLLYRWLFRYVFDIQVRLARQLLTAYLNAPYTFHFRRNSAELIKTMTETLMGSPPLSW